MDAFVFVKPTSDGMHPATAAWVQAEMDRAIREWHRQMRGDVRVVAADQLTDDDIRDKHLILWGDPNSNPKLAEILEQLPLQWDAENVSLGHHQFDAQHCVPAMIYPNPLAPNRYVVLNSGLTYREYDYLNNARQVPKLPDWAMIDTRTPADARWPGKILAADFFSETWTVK